MTDEFKISHDVLNEKMSELSNNSAMLVSDLKSKIDIRFADLNVKINNVNHITNELLKSKINKLEMSLNEIEHRLTNDINKLQQTIHEITDKQYEMKQEFDTKLENLDDTINIIFKRIPSNH